MDNLLQVFTNNLLPVLLLSAAGYLLGKSLTIDTRSIGRTTFYVFSPVLVFNLLTQTQLAPGKIALMFGFGVSCTVVMGGLAYLVGRLMRLQHTVLMALVLASMFGNSGNYGLPLVAFAFGQEALAYAGVFFVSSSLMVNTAGVVIASLGHMQPKDAVVALFKVPAVYAILLALLVVQMDLTLPIPLERTLSLAANGAVPVMIVLLGLELQRARWCNQHAPAITASVALRLLAAPLVALCLSIPMGLDTPARQAGVIENSVPTAVMTTILAGEYKLEPSMVTTIVFISTVLSPLTLTPLIVFLGR